MQKRVPTGIVSWVKVFDSTLKGTLRHIDPLLFRARFVLTSLLPHSGPSLTLSGHLKGLLYPSTGGRNDLPDKDSYLPITRHRQRFRSSPSKISRLYFHDPPHVTERIEVPFMVPSRYCLRSDTGSSSHLSLPPFASYRNSCRK